MLANTACVPCGCYASGSNGSSCDEIGKCTCKDKFHGAKCDNRDCEMGTWGAWTTCKCGYSNPKNRTRSVLHPPLGDGKACPPSHETASCTMVPCNCAIVAQGYHGDRCEDKHCQWSSWGSWSSCIVCSSRGCSSNSCPDFYPQKTRTRSVAITKQGEGNPCTGSSSESNSCGYRCTLQCNTVYGGSVCAFVQG